MSSANENNLGIPVFHVFVLVLLIGSGAFFLGRPPVSKDAGPSSSAKSRHERGAELARTLCASCHLEPAPEVATRDRWALEILPAKADLLGVGTSTNTTVISHHDWRAVCNHYLAQAPDEFPNAEESQHPKTDRFLAVAMNHPTATRMTMGRIDPAAGVIYVGNADDKTIDIIAPDGRLLAARPMGQAPLAAVPTADGVIVALGEPLAESDEPTGSLVFLGKPGSAGAGVRVVADKLIRPVDLVVDSLGDIFVAEAGRTQGRLLRLKKTAGGYEPGELASGAPYRALALGNLTSEGRQVVFALRSGQQAVELYQHTSGGIRGTNFMTKHPAWYFSDLAALPFRPGSPPVIITANGNDRRFRRQPRVPIPYHGLHILNLGNVHASFFQPLQNARRLVARDFDGDEDIDIVAIGYSGDHRQAAHHGAVYLEHEKDGTFTAHRLPHSADAHWSDVDAGDVDGDGDPDIVITAFHPGERNAPEARLRQWDQSPTTCLLLLNQTIP